MKKWILLLTAVVLVFIICFVLIYFTAKQQVNSELEVAEEAAEAEGMNISDSYHYHGSEAYYVVTGTIDGEEQLYFYPENNELDTVLIPVEGGVQEQQVIEMLNEDDQPQKILSSKIGMESVGPVWEVIYRDEDELLNYYYVKFESGDWWRTIRNL
ncbi:hypothetical protein JMA_19570 [Jeotgalibacillus malaysiensis]|uniref:DUF5590 domain-containing protein n=1 Tax=Jeotgalibacillus malaysiensis TaxID=1508404 RepID=A0A0B5ATC2_9BACL|nr:hypothetical protein [Jeotgalibacillus malaysiensis]AJD91274.1 hypothetical protein JMA_19570 [Jeotgalibacillus malaysiensis]